MKKIELEFLTVTNNITQSQNYAAILSEKKGKRRIPVVIGPFEAQAIAVVQQKMNPSRPQTHDLMKNSLEVFDVQIKEVIINNLLDGIFYAQLICTRNGQVEAIDSRTSDAIAMALRFRCPIYTYDFVLEAAGISFEEPDEADATSSKSRVQRVRNANLLSEKSMSDLQSMLDEALTSENYERAAEIRDEMNKRKD
jgi:bifunctional DNase/RNase